MTKNLLSNRTTLFRYWLCSMLLVMGLGVTNANAQAIYNYTFSNTTPGGYTLLSGATTLAPTNANNDDGISSLTSIGFSFKFGGTLFTDFKMNTNGWMTFNAASVTNTGYASLNSAETQVIAGFSRDIRTTNMSYLLTGVSGSQILKLQWDGVTSASAVTVPAASTFQIWLYEGSNVVEIRYGAFTVGTRTLGTTCQVGLKGVANSLITLSGTNWTNPNPVNNPAATMPVTTTILPDDGRMYRFSPPSGCDNSLLLGEYAAVVAPVGGSTVTITTCQFAGEYASIINVVSGASYRSTSNIPTDFITISFGSPGGLVVASGFPPLVWIANANGTYYMHTNTNTSCGTSFVCRVTTIANTLGCTNITAGATSNAPTGSNIVVNQTAASYTTINNVSAGTSYTSTSSVPTDYITIHANAPNGPILIAGLSPLIWTSTYAGTYFQHVNTNTSCGTANVTRTINEEISTSTPPSCASIFTPPTGTGGICNGSVPFTLSWSSVALATGYDVYYGTPTEVLVSSNQPGTNFVVNSLLPNTTYYWRVVPRNQYGPASGCVTNNFTTQPDNCYCASTANFPTSDEDILNVSMGSLNNSSTCGQLAPGAGSVGGSYSNYTGSVAAPVLEIGSSVNVAVNIGYCGAFAYNDICTVYIDYNHNGVFDETPVFSSIYGVHTYPSEVVSGNFLVPNTAVLGNTRMRVVLSESTTAPACGTISYGEIEDYNVNIAPIPACVSPIVSIGGITQTSAVVSWTCSGCTGPYTLDYGPAGHLAGTGTQVVAPTSPYTITGLTTGVGYTVFLRQECGGTAGSSTWIQVDFNTLHPGDICSVALPLQSCGASGGYQSLQGSTIGHTRSILGAPICGGENTSSPDIWYTLVGNGAQMTVSTCDLGTLFDTNIGVYSGNCGALTCVTSNDDNPLCANAGVSSGLTSSVTWNTVNGETYFIRIGGFGNSSGNFVLNASCVTPPVPVAYVSTVVTPGTECVSPGASATIAKIAVTISGHTGTLPVSGFVVNDQGTSDYNSLGAAHIYFTGTSPVFSSAIEFANAPAGTFTHGSGASFNLGASTPLQLGGNIGGNTTYYFWLVFDISNSAPLCNIGNGMAVVDGEVVSIYSDINAQNYYDDFSTIMPLDGNVPIQVANNFGPSSTINCRNVTLYWSRTCGYTGNYSVYLNGLLITPSSGISETSYVVSIIPGTSGVFWQVINVGGTYTACNNLYFSVLSTAEICYNVPSTDACDNDDITQFTICGQSRPSAPRYTNGIPCNPGYSDYHLDPAKDIYLESCGSCPVTICTGGPIGPLSQEGIKIWVDFNDNGSFEDSGELIFDPTTLTTGSLGSMCISGTISIPTSAPGGSHRLRVRSVFATTTFTSVTPGFFGETEDYTVHITPFGGTALPDFNGNSLVSTNGSIGCIHQPGQFCVQGGGALSGVLGYAYSTTPGGPYTAITDANGAPLSDLCQSLFADFSSMSGTYYIVATLRGGCPNQTVNSNEVSITINSTVAYDQPCNPAACGSNILTCGANSANGYSNVGATVDANEPAPPASGCYVQNGWCNSDLSHTLWFQYTYPASGGNGGLNIHAKSGGNSGLPNFDSQLAVWESNTGSGSSCTSFTSSGAFIPGSMNLIAANDDDAGAHNDFAFSSYVSIPACTLLPGHSYWIQVNGFNGSQGQFQLIIDCPQGTASFSYPSFLVDVNTDPGLCTASNVNLGTPTVNPGSCPLTFTNNAPAIFPTGQTVVTWTGTDIYGNSSNTDPLQLSSYQNVNVTNASAPIVTVQAQNLNVECDGHGNLTEMHNWLEVTHGGSDAADDCTPHSYIDAHWFNSFQTMSIGCSQYAGTSGLISFATSDDAGNTSGSTFATFTISDTQGPVMSGCPANTSVQCLADADLTAGNVTANDLCSGPATVNYSFSESNPGSSCNNIVTRTWTATDDCGNSSSCQQVITVNSSTPPALNCPANIVVTSKLKGCGAIVCYTEPTGTSGAGCGGLPITVLSSGIASGNIFPVGVTTVTYTATNLCGVSTSCSFTVTVNNPAAPVFTEVPNAGYCQDNLGLSVSVPGGGSYSYQWAPTPQVVAPPVTPINSPNQVCYVSVTPSLANVVNANSTWTIDSVAHTVKIRTTLAKTFVDNTYGTSQIGWPGNNHTFSSLVGSDKLQLALYDAAGVQKMEFKMDYITATSTVPSGYKSLGVLGGDGGMILGSSTDVLNVVTSLDVNFNTYGYVLTTNSPSTNSLYTPNPSYPNWIYDVWYEVTVRLSAFGTSGFGTPKITSTHASPSKTGNNTELVNVTPCGGIVTPPPPTACSGSGLIYGSSTGSSVSVSNHASYTVTVTESSTACNGNTNCSQTFTYCVNNTGSNLISNYVILGTTDVHIHGYSKVLNGGVGVSASAMPMTASGHHFASGSGNGSGCNGGRIKIHNHTTFVDGTTFAIGKCITVDATSHVAVKYPGVPANPPLPAFDAGVVIPSGAANLSIPDNSLNYHITGLVYGNITIGKNSTVILDQATLDCRALVMKDGSKLSSVQNNVKIRMEGNLVVGKNCVVNPINNNHDFAIYVQHANNTGSGAAGSGGSGGHSGDAGGTSSTSVSINSCSSVKAFIFAPTGKLSVHGPGGHGGAGSGSGSGVHSTECADTLKGLFIAKTVISHGTVVWDWNTQCASTNVSPQITCVNDINTNSKLNGCGAIVCYNTPIASANAACPGVVSVVRTAGPSSGSVFPLGVTTVTHKVTDACGNTAECSFNVTVNNPAAPTIAETPGTDYCQGNMTLTATVPGGGTYDYNWTSADGVITSGQGTSSVSVTNHAHYTVTVSETSLGCSGTSTGCSQPFTYYLNSFGTEFISNYVIVGATDVHLHGYSKVLNGGVGASAAAMPMSGSGHHYASGSGNGSGCNGGRIKIHDHTNFVDGTTFVKAKCINIDASSHVTVRYPGAPANPPLPVFDAGVTIPSNAVNLNIPDNSTNYHITGLVYGTITIGKNAVVICNHGTLDCKSITMKDGSKIKSVQPNFKIRIKGKLVVGKSCVINPSSDNHDFSIYLSHLNNVGSGGAGSGGGGGHSGNLGGSGGGGGSTSTTVSINSCSKVKALIYAPTGKFSVHGPGGHHNGTGHHIGGSGSGSGVMSADCADTLKGLFIAKTIISHGTVVWDWNTNCPQVANNDNSPVITCPEDMVVTNKLNGCGATVCYIAPSGTASTSCPGATNTVRTSGPASGSVFPVGVTTITHKVTDHCGNTAACSFNVTVNDAASPTITETPSANYCQGRMTLTANVPGGGTYSYNWTSNDGTISAGQGTAVVAVTNHAHYTVAITETSSGCSGPSTNCTQSVSYYLNSFGSDLVSNYVILGSTDVHLHGYSKVLNGGVGASASAMPSSASGHHLTSGSGDGSGCNGGRIKIHDHTNLVDGSTFVKAKCIAIDGTSHVTVRYPGSPANPPLPAFDGGITIPSNAVNLNISDNTPNYHITGAVYGTITIGKNATVIIHHGTLDCRSIIMKDGSKMKSLQSCLRIRVKGNLVIGKNCVVNPVSDNHDFAIYVTHLNNTGSGGHGSGGGGGHSGGSGGSSSTSVSINSCSKVKAFIYAPTGKFSVHGPGGHHSGTGHHAGGSGSGSGVHSVECADTLKGLFIAKTLISHGTVVWDWNTACASCAAAYAAREGDEAEDGSTSLITEDLNSGLTVENFPDPFKDKTNIRFIMDTDTHARVEVYDMNGRFISTIFNSDVVAKKEYRFEFDGTDLSNGMYIYKVITPNDVHTGKMLLIKN